VIRATGLTLRRHVKVLLEDAEFVVHPGERVGIVGKNGAGKSTLFALLQGQLDPDAGSLTLPADWRIATVQQEIAASARPAREFVIDADTPLRQLQAQREAIARSADDDTHADDDSHADAGTRLAELDLMLADAGLYTAASRAEQLLAGLGFAPDEWHKPVTHFSGGWRMRVALARALMAPSDLLLLDEPTNHLDLDAMLWLERWLAAYPGTVLVISHDSEFLDAVARTILHFDARKLLRYRGGYQDFLLQRAERLRQVRLAHARQTREAAHLQSFIDRFKAKASKAKQAQSRVKALARMQTLTPLYVEAGIAIRIPSPAHTPDPLLTLEGVSAGYGDAPILREVTLRLRAGGRIGVLGVNGAGKSTLIKTLAAELAPLAGVRHAAKGLVIGYFHQHQLDMLDADATPLQHLTRLAPGEREQDLRNYLGGFGFSGDAVHAQVGSLSGGEKARLALALIVWQKPNLLLLDEPSNHLDADTRAALTAALAEFDGSMLLVSHDRHLLRTTVDSFWIVADGTVHEFDGDLEDYRAWLAHRLARERDEKPDPGNAALADAGESNRGESNRKAQRRRDAEVRQRLASQRKPLARQLAQVEAHIDALRARLQTLEATIAEADLYTDARRAERQQVLTEHGELAKRMQTLEDEWLAVQEELEALEAPGAC